jgi:phospholipid-binding lipoprotein MlaA
MTVPVACRSALALAATLAVGCASGPPADPWQEVNRPVFQMNDGLDRWVLRPVARGWTFVTFEELRESVSRFYFNARFPVRFVSSLGQGKGEEALNEVGRFLVNTTVGVAGLFDPATEFGFPRSDEDVGQMFGRWGIPAGPYWVIPLLGPSSPRDAAGMVGDLLLSPFLWIDAPVYGLGVVNAINSRALADAEIENAKRTALDYYVFVRDAYVQNRQAAVEDRSTGGTGGPYDDLYDLPDDEHDDPTN